MLSELFSVARHAGRSEPGSKPIQLRWLREFLRYLCSNSRSVCLFTFLYPIGYQSAQFFRRALYYASGGRQFFRQSAQPPWESVYIVIHRQCVCVCVCVRAILMIYIQINTVNGLCQCWESNFSLHTYTRTQIRKDCSILLGVPVANMLGCNIVVNRNPVALLLLFFNKLPWER